MYIRRKVFSLLRDEETGEERYFSTTEFEMNGGGYELEQREFGLGDKVIKGVKKVKGKADSAIRKHITAPIGRKRKEISEKLYKEAEEGLKLQEDAIKNLHKLKGVHNPEIEQKIKKEIQDKGASVYYGPSNSLTQANGGGAWVPKKGAMGIEYQDALFPGSLEKDITETAKKAGRAGAVYADNSKGLEFLGHEGGHSANSVGNRWERFINKSSSQGRNLLSFNKGVKRDTRGEGKGIIKHIKDAGEMVNNSLVAGIQNIAGKVTVSEEARASKKALDMLKRHGATPKELETAKKNLDNALNSYKGLSKASKKSSLARAIAIPSNRPTIGDISLQQMERRDKLMDLMNK